MRNFIEVPTEAGPIVLGVSQIASMTPGGRRGQHASIRMGNGQIFEALVHVDAVLDLIETATADPVPAPAPLPVTVTKKSKPK